MKRAITIFGILAILGLVSWILPGAQASGASEKETVETAVVQQQQVQQVDPSDQEDLSFVQAAKNGIKRFFS
ncbi:MAG: hypothetical protein WCW86_00580, partial [Bacteroidales bacterium]